MGNMFKTRRAGQLEPFDLVRLPLDPVQLTHSVGEIDAHDGGGRRYLGPSGLVVTCGKVHLTPFHAVSREGRPPLADLQHARGRRHPFHLLEEWLLQGSISYEPTSEVNSVVIIPGHHPRSK